MRIRMFGILALMGLILAVVLRPVASQDGDQGALEHRIDTTVREYGLVESAQTVGIINDVGGEMTIRSIVPDGSMVKKGDVLVEFDDSQLRDTQSQAQREVRTAQVGIQQAKLELESATKIAKQLGQLGESKIKTAQLNYEKYTKEGGVFDVTLRNAKRDAELAESRLKLATHRMDRQKSTEGAVAQADLEAVQLEAEKSRTEAAKAQDQIQLLTTLERPYQTAALELAVSQAKLESMQEARESQKSILQAESELEEAKLALNNAEAKLARTDDLLAKCRVAAPFGGMVIYPAASRRSSIPDVFKPGGQVAQGVTILEVADLTQLQVRAHVHESRINRVKKGQSANLRFDAFPGGTFQGKVLSVNQNPEPATWLSAETKSYAVKVSIDGPLDRLKLGMSALVEIETP